MDHFKNTYKVLSVKALEEKNSCAMHRQNILRGSSVYPFQIGTTYTAHMLLVCQVLLKRCFEKYYEHYQGSIYITGFS